MDLSKRQIFLVVKASSVSDFEAVQKSLDDSHANWGFDVSAADQNFRLRFELEESPSVGVHMVRNHPAWICF